MDIQTYYTKSTQQLSFLFNKSQDLSYSTKSSQSTNSPSSDKLTLSDEIQEISNLGLKLTNYNQTKDNSDYNFEYNFSNDLIQVQSSGNFDTSKDKGNINLVINLGKVLSKNSKISILPKDVKLELNLSISEAQTSNEKNQIEEPPDMIAIITQLLKNMNQVTKDSPDKDLKSLFSSIVSTFSSSGDDKKVNKDIINAVQSLSQNSQTQTKSQKTKSQLLLGDKTIDIAYKDQSVKLDLKNIQLGYDISTDTIQA